MNNFPVLSFLIFFPLLGAFLIYLTDFKYRVKEKFIKSLALMIVFIEFIFSLLMYSYYDPLTFSMQFIENSSLNNSLFFKYTLGIDGVSIFFILLTTFLIPICLLVSWDSVKYRLKEFLISFLVLESFTIGSFCANDIILFFIFFEAVLIPMFFIIGIWGGENKIYASFKFFIYTFFGSIFLLISFIYICYTTKTTNIVELCNILPTYPLSIQKWLWFGLFISFAIKVPIWPFHTWLPDAHVQAPTSGSVILAGILLKFGGYGFLRFSLPMLPQASYYYSDFVIVLSIIAIIYTSLIALVQNDMKKLIAYSSVAHMGFVTAGIFSFTQQGIEGAIFQMISHGLVSGALFICIGLLYERMHTKEIAFYGGLTSFMPRFAFIFMIFTLSSIGLPGTSGFVGEFLVLLAIFKVSKIYSLLMAFSMVLGAAYMLGLYARIMFGEIQNDKLSHIKDLNNREYFTTIPIIIILLYIGIYPKLITDNIKNSVTVLHNATNNFNNINKI